MCKRYQAKLRIMLLIAPTLVIATMLSSCGSSSNDPSPVATAAENRAAALEQFKANKKKWQDSGITSYRLRIRDSFLSITITSTVRNGVVEEGDIRRGENEPVYADPVANAYYGLSYAK